MRRNDDDTSSLAPCVLIEPLEPRLMLSAGSALSSITASEGIVVYPILHQSDGTAIDSDGDGWVDEIVDLSAAGNNLVAQDPLGTPNDFCSHTVTTGGPTGDYTTAWNGGLTSMVAMADLQRPEFYWEADVIFQPNFRGAGQGGISDPETRIFSTRGDEWGEGVYLQANPDGSLTAGTTWGGLTITTAPGLIADNVWVNVALSFEDVTDGGLTPFDPDPSHVEEGRQIWNGTLKIYVNDVVVASAAGGYVPNDDGFGPLIGQLRSFTGITPNLGVDNILITGRFPGAGLLGDMDGSGAVNNNDISPFVLALTDRPTYEATYPGIDADVVGDIDGSGTLNNNDITAFVQLLTGGGPQADLQVTDVSIPTKANVGEQMYVEWTVSNLGNVNTSSKGSLWIDKVYLSLDQTIDAGDVLLRSISGNGHLGAGGSYTSQTTVTIPENTSEEPHYIIVKTDVTNAIQEYPQGDSNNVRVETLSVDVPYVAPFDEVSPKPLWGDVNQPYDQLPGTYETQHVPWARPLPEGKLEVLFILPYSNSREVIELAQRLDLNYTVIMTAGEDSWWDGPVNNSVYPGTPIGGTDAQNTVNQIADARLSLSNYYDAIVIGKVSWASIPGTYQSLILQHVAGGTGLAYVSSDPPSSLFATDLNLPIESDIVGDFPFSIMPFSVEITTNYYGAGRRIALDYDDTSGGDDSLSANVDYDPVMYDYNMAILAKAVRWSAGIDAAVQPDIHLNAVVNRDALGATNIEFSASASDGSAMPVVLFEYAMRNDLAEVIWQGQEVVGIPAGGTGYAYVPMPTGLARGRYLIDLRVLDASFRTLDFASASVFIDNDEYVSYVATDDDRYEEGQAIAGLATFSKELEADQSAVVRVVDTWGRIVFESPLTLTGPRTGGTFSIPVSNPLSHIWDINVVIQDANGDDVASRGTWVGIPRQDFNEYYWGIIFAPMPGNGSWKAAMYAQRMRDFGINGAFTMLIYSYFDQLEAAERQNMINLIYGDHNGQIYNPKAASGNDGQGNTDWNFEFSETCLGEINDMFEYVIDTGNLMTDEMFPYLFNQGSYDLSASWWANKLLSFERAGQFGTPFFTLTGENYLSGEQPGTNHDENSCFCDHCTQQFQEWLQGITDGRWNNSHINNVPNPHPYGSLSELNAEWNTSFTSWSQVRGILYDDAVAQNQLPRWVDFRYFMRSAVWTEFFINYTDAIRVFVPGAKTGTTGHDQYDFTRMGSEMTSAKIYNLQQDVDELDTMVRQELQQSFSGDSSYLIGAASVLRWEPEYHTPRRNFRMPWKMLFMGFKGFDWENFLPPGVLGGMSSLTPDLSEALPFMANISDQVRYLQGGIGDLANSADPLRSEVAILWSPPNHYISGLHPEQTNGFSGSWLANVSTDFGAHHDALGMLKSIGIRGTFVSPEQVMNGRLASGEFKALILPYSKGMSVGEANAIRTFVANGGLVIADNTPGIYTEHGRQLSPSEYRLKNLFPVTNQNYGLNYGNGRAQYMHNGINGYIDEMKAGNYGSGDQLASYLEQYAGITPAVKLIDGDGNPRRDTLMPIYVKGSARYVGMMRHELSDGLEGPKTTAQLDATYHVWNVRDQQYVGYVNTFDINLDMYPKFYALLPSNPVQMDIVPSTGSVEQGQTLSVTGTVTFNDSNPDIATMGQVVHVEVYGPDLQEIEAYRDNVLFQGAEFTIDLPVSYSEGPGTYTVQVAYPVTGMTAQTTFEVLDGAPPAAISAVESLQGDSLDGAALHLTYSDLDGLVRGGFDSEETVEIFDTADARAAYYKAVDVPEFQIAAPAISKAGTAAYAGELTQVNLLGLERLRTADHPASGRSSLLTATNRLQTDDILASLAEAILPAAVETPLA